MRAITAMCLSFAVLFGLIWLIWWAGVVDGQVTLQITGDCSGNGTHIFTIAGANVTGNCLNWTITN